MERMNDEQVLAAFKKTDAIRTGHFKLTSGRHSDTYIHCARILEHPTLTMQLAAEDVVTTGGSVKDVCALVEASGGQVAGIVSMIDRSAAPDFGAAYYPLLRLETPSWEEGECEQCKQGVVIDSPGIRRLAII